MKWNLAFWVGCPIVDRDEFLRFPSPNIDDLPEIEGRPLSRLPDRDRPPLVDGWFPGAILRDLVLPSSFLTRSGPDGPIRSEVDALLMMQSDNTRK